MQLKIDVGSALPLYTQIAAQLRAAIAKGDVSEGDTLPAAKDLAEALGVNIHTILRAYGELRDEGVLELRRRRGAVVIHRGPGRARLKQLARSLVDEAVRQGLTRREVRALIEDLL